MKLCWARKLDSTCVNQFRGFSSASGMLSWLAWPELSRRYKSCWSYVSPNYWLALSSASRLHKLSSVWNRKCGINGPGRRIARKVWEEKEEQATRTYNPHHYRVVIFGKQRVIRFQSSLITVTVLLWTEFLLSLSIHQSLLLLLFPRLGAHRRRHGSATFNISLIRQTVVVVKEKDQ